MDIIDHRKPDGSGIETVCIKASTALAEKHRTAENHHSVSAAAMIPSRPL